MELRKIKQNEIDLIKFILGKNNQDIDNYVIPKMVSNLNDGNMGSFRFDISINKESEEVASYEFLDIDNIAVIVTIYKYKNTNILKELDIWKVNFEPLISNLIF